MCVRPRSKGMRWFIAWWSTVELADATEVAAHVWPPSHAEVKVARSVHVPVVASRRLIVVPVIIAGWWSRRWQVAVIVARCLQSTDVGRSELQASGGHGVQSIHLIASVVVAWRRSLIVALRRWAVVAMRRRGVAARRGRVAAVVPARPRGRERLGGQARKTRQQEASRAEARTRRSSGAHRMPAVVSARRGTRADQTHAARRSSLARGGAQGAARRLRRRRGWL